MDLGLLRQHAPEAMQRLLELLRSDDNRAVAFAITTIFERGFGKAPVGTEGGGDSLSLLHLIAARSIAETLQHAVEAGLPPTIDLNAVAKAGPVDLLTLVNLPPALE